MESLPTLLTLFAPIHRGQFLRGEIISQLVALQEPPPLNLGTNLCTWLDMAGGEVIALVLANYHRICPLRARLQRTHAQPMASHPAGHPTPLTESCSPTAQQIHRLSLDRDSSTGPGYHSSLAHPSVPLRMPKVRQTPDGHPALHSAGFPTVRSEEHTSELQS